MKLKIRRELSSSPAIDLPVRPQELSSRRLAQVQQQRVLSPVKLLRKFVYWLRLPVRPVRRLKDRNIERFLFNNVRDFHRQKKNLASRPAHIYGQPIAFRCDSRFLRNQEGVDHGDRIVANHMTRPTRLTPNPELMQLCGSGSPTRTSGCSRVGPGVRPGRVDAVVWVRVSDPDEWMQLCGSGSLTRTSGCSSVGPGLRPGRVDAVVWVRVSDPGEWMQSCGSGSPTRTSECSSVGPGLRPGRVDAVVWVRVSDPDEWMQSCGSGSLTRTSGCSSVGPGL